MQVTVICETFLSSDIPDSLICSRGYNIFRKDRDISGGGVALLVRDDLCAKHVAVKNEYDGLELICVDVDLIGVMYRAIVYYRRPLYDQIDVDYVKTSTKCLADLIPKNRHSCCLWETLISQKLTGIVTQVR